MCSFEFKLFVTVLMLVGVLTGQLFSIDEVHVPEFQYPCYTDLCTFPMQFCDDNRRRCGVCNRLICDLDEGRIPLACRYICLKQSQSKYVNFITCASVNLSELY